MKRPGVSPRSTVQSASAWRAVHLSSVRNCSWKTALMKWLRFCTRRLPSAPYDSPMLAPSTFSVTVTGSPHATSCAASAGDSSRSSRVADPRLARCGVRGNLVRWASSSEGGGGGGGTPPSAVMSAAMASNPTATSTVANPSSTVGGSRLPSAPASARMPSAGVVSVGWPTRRFRRSRHSPASAASHRHRAVALARRPADAASVSHSRRAAAVRLHMSTSSGVPRRSAAVATSSTSPFRRISSRLTRTMPAPYASTSARATVLLPLPGSPTSRMSGGSLCAAAAAAGAVAAGSGAGATAAGAAATGTGAQVTTADPSVAGASTRQGGVSGARAPFQAASTAASCRARTGAGDRG